MYDRHQVKAPHRELKGEGRRASTPSFLPSFHLRFHNSCDDDSAPSTGLVMSSPALGTSHSAAATTRLLFLFSLHLRLELPYPLRVLDMGRSSRQAIIDLGQRTRLMQVRRTRTTPRAAHLQGLGLNSHGLFFTIRCTSFLLYYLLFV